MFHALTTRSFEQPIIAPIRGVTPMPATKDDVQRLRGILRYATTGQHVMSVREQTLHAALETAIDLLDEGMAPSPTQWILGALYQSMEERGNGLWIVTNRELNTWAMDQLKALHGPFGRYAGVRPS